MSKSTPTVDAPTDNSSTEVSGAEPLLISLGDAAEMLSISYWLMWRLVRDDVIPSVYQGHRRYVTPQALRDYVANLPTTAPENDTTS